MQAGAALPFRWIPQPTGSDQALPSVLSLCWQPCAATPPGTTPIAFIIPDSMNASVGLKRSRVDHRDDGVGRVVGSIRTPRVSAARAPSE